jgi:hypothetical protein
MIVSSLDELASLPVGTVVRCDGDPEGQVWTKEIIHGIVKWTTRSLRSGGSLLTDDAALWDSRTTRIPIGKLTFQITVVNLPDQDELFTSEPRS